MTNENKESKFREYIEKNKENELVEKVLNSKTSFVKEVQDFYDVNLSYGFKGSSQDSRKWKKSNKTKYGQAPKQLLFMLEPFTEEGKLNPEYLTYEKVRKEVKKAERFSLGTFLGFTGGFAGLITTTTGALTTVLAGDLKQALPIGLGIFGASIYGLIKNVKYFNKETLEGNEFFKLKNVANYVADPFIEKYRIYKELQGEKIKWHGYLQ